MSTASGDVADFTLLNDLVQVQVVTQPTITATSDGTTASVTTSPYAVDVTVGGETTRLTAGGSLPIELDLGVADVSIVLSVGTLTDTSARAVASGDMTFLSTTGEIGTLLADVMTLDVGLVPLSVSAEAPAGWVVPVTDPLSCGVEHTLSATQTVALARRHRRAPRAVSPASAPVQFTVACPSPGNGSDDGNGGVPTTSAMPADWPTPAPPPAWPAWSRSGCP